MEKLYYVSQGDGLLEHLQNIEKVSKAGVKLIQLRLKNVTEEQYFETAIQAKAICNDSGSTLIINDSIAVAKRLGVGVHLGLGDKPISLAKKELMNVVIGGTANTLEDCLKLMHQRVDYIGLGPFRFTETKKKLSPILGVEGYKNIITTLRSKGYEIPIYAIGGITEEDFESLFDIGVSGIAVSGLLSNCKEEEIKKKLLKVKEVVRSY